MALMTQAAAPRIAVIIPSYKVTDHILGVIARIGTEIERIYVIDDCCPNRSGDYVKANCTDSRVTVARNEANVGVGGAVVAGYRAAIADGMEILVKIDGDGQMDASLIPQLVAPIVQGTADYAKGNRFFSPEALEGMPATRLIGNAGLSFLTKMSSGYWDVLDPTNGFTAIHALVADVIPMHKLARRYFFESDLLFRLNTVRAVVADIPMFSVYGREKSNLKVGRVLVPFFFKNFANTWKRIVYAYFLRGFSFASFCLLFGWALFIFGITFGSTAWIRNSIENVGTPTGTIMVSVVSLILGFQLLMGFVAADIASVPTRALHPSLSTKPAKPLRPFKDVKRSNEAPATTKQTSLEFFDGTTGRRS